MSSQVVFQDGGRPCGSEVAGNARRADEEADVRGRHFRPYHQTMNVIWRVGSAVLWLGGWHCGNDWELMEEHNIKHVVNCTDRVQSHPDLGRKGGTTFLKFMVTAGGYADNAFDFFRPVFESIVAALAAGKSVLIHCRAGAHRAGTTACAVVMHLGRLGVEEAARMVKKSRSVVSISGDFWRLLKRLEADMRRDTDGPPAALPEPASSSSAPAPKAMPKRVGPLPPPLAPAVSPGASPREPPAVAREPASNRVVHVDLEPSSEEDTIGTVNVAALAAEVPETDSEPELTQPRFQKGWVDNPGAKLLMLSWNPGAGCRRMMDRIGSSGYNVVVLQEAKEAWAGRFPAGWVVQISQCQLFAARAPVRIRNCGRLGVCFSLHAINAIM